MNYISDNEKAVISAKYREELNMLNMQYHTAFPAMDALKSFHNKMVELGMGEYHAFTLGNNGEIRHYTNCDHSSENCVASIIFRYDGIFLCFHGTTMTFNKYRENKPFTFTCDDYDKMMKGEDFDPQKIIKDHQWHVSVNETLAKALKMLDALAVKMEDLISEKENRLCAKQRKIVDFFNCADTVSKTRRIRITVEEIEE